MKQDQVTIGIIFPYVWTIVFILLIIISYMSSKISYLIAAQNLIVLSFIFSPIIFISGIIISLLAMLKSGISRNILFGLILNIFLFFIWFSLRMPFYIELNMIS